jgi:hypothetical protein
MSSRFLRLTNFLVNVNQIRRIEIHPGAYKIQLIQDELKGVTFMGTGYFTSQTESYTATEKDHINDYKIIADWINNIENNKNQ